MLCRIWIDLRINSGSFELVSLEDVAMWLNDYVVLVAEFHALEGAGRHHLKVYVFALEEFEHLGNLENECICVKTLLKGLFRVKYHFWIVIDATRRLAAEDDHHILPLACQ